MPRYGWSAACGHLIFGPCRIMLSFSIGHNRLLEKFSAHPKPVTLKSPHRCSSVQPCRGMPAPATRRQLERRVSVPEMPLLLGQMAGLIFKLPERDGYMSL